MSPVSDSFRSSVTVAALKNLIVSDSWEPELAKAIALHSVLLEQLPLPERALSVPPLADACRASPQTQQFLHAFFKATVEVLLTSSSPKSAKDPSMSDFFDGRVFFCLLDILTRPIPAQDSLGLPEATLKATQALLDQVSPTLSASSPLAYFHGPEPKDVTRPAVFQQAGPALFPVSSKWVAEVLGETFSNIPTLDEQDPSVVAAQDSGLDMIRVHHWNSSCAPLMDTFWNQTSKGASTGEGTGGWREVRAEQFLARFIHQYAESLEGSAALHQKAIVLGKSSFVGGEPTPSTTAALPEENAEASPAGKKGAPPKKGKAPKAGAPKKKSKADEIREANLARLKKKEEDGEFTRWSSIKVQLEDWIKTDPPRVEPTVKEFTRTCQVSLAALEAQMWRLNLYFTRWRVSPTSSDRIVAVFNQIHRVVDRHGKDLDEEKSNILQQCLADMGFSDSAALLVRDLGCKSSFIDQGAPKQSAIRFMLQHMGHLLKRKDSSGPDARVGFVPDRWQEELLDVVDRRGSALVCAPTSSGKTFISYYCMEQVLRESPSGVAVFVAPTKALVNQVAAEVYARFGTLQSSYGDGVSVFGYFTRDYRYKPLKCRVLVTVPDCLEMLLLSPQAQFEEWRKRLRYVIFDEVHSIGDLAFGEIWEHAMSLVSCPILALSATVRNPNDLKEWIEVRQRLQEVQEKRRIAAGVPQRGSARSYEVALISHHNRYADLEKSVFLPVLGATQDAALESAWKLPASSHGKFCRLHPCVSLSGKRLRDFGFPSDVSFEPRDSLDLFDAMKLLESQLPLALQQSLAALNPETLDLFQGVRRLTRPMARQYEALIKTEIERWAKDGHESLVDAALKTLASNYQRTMAETETALAALGTRMESETYLHNYIVDAIFTLASQERLPVIVFNFDAEVCEKLLQLLVERLEKEEYRKSQTEDSIKERRTLQKAREAQSRKQKLMRDAKLKEKTAIELVQKEHDAAFIPEEEEVDRDFSYCAPDVEISKEALDIIKSYPAKIPWVRAVKRGIGVHHAGLPTKYRQAVERLFRVRAIQVVFATSTLSLGIHMPCKTVVFAGDSVSLNSLTFRQMSGRAGRRGFDKLGTVAFMGIPDAKINRLLTGDLAVLQSSMPTSLGLVHRCENLLRFSKSRESDEKACVRLFKSPLAPNISQADVKLHFRYAEDLLRQQGLIGADGIPIGLSELPVHLFWMEPSGFFVHSLIRSGLLYPLTDDLRIKSKGIEPIFKELLQLFSVVVAPQKLHPGLRRHPIGSKVILERPTEGMENFINQYNQQLLASFVKFAAAAAPRSDDSSLPLSNVSFASKQASVGYLLSKLAAHATPSSVRSPFAGSADGDAFHSAGELAHNVRESIVFDASMLPSIEGLDSQNFVLNRFAMDFFESNSLEALRTDNALRGSAWLTLNNFVLGLQGIKVALTALQPPGRDQFVHIFSKLVDEYALRFNRLTWFS